MLHWLHVAFTSGSILELFEYLLLNGSKGRCERLCSALSRGCRLQVASLVEDRHVVRIVPAVCAAVLGRSTPALTRAS